MSSYTVVDGLTLTVHRLNDGSTFTRFGYCEGSVETHAWGAWHRAPALAARVDPGAARAAVAAFLELGLMALDDELCLRGFGAR